MIKNNSNLSLIIPCYNEQENLHLLFKKLSQAQFCLRFCMSVPEVSLTIAGMMSEKEVIENSDVLDMKAFNKKQIQYIINFNRDNEPFIRSNRWRDHRS